MPDTDRLIIFTRYPEPGKAKTRLIPALGTVGAADLHRQMAEHTIAQARVLQPYVSLEVRFTGAHQTQMQTWLGDDLDYQMQSAGDLGDRLIDALRTAFSRGATAVIIIGTDCPQLDGALLQTAFEKLHDSDLVLGPATDGGYYLIGLRQLIPELFQAIAWSTDGVLSQTLAIAHALQLAIAQLPPLSDVDYPDDLAIWHQVKSEGAGEQAANQSSDS